MYIYARQTPENRLHFVNEALKRNCVCIWKQMVNKMCFDHIVCLTLFFGIKINYSCVIDEHEIDLKMGTIQWCCFCRNQVENIEENGPFICHTFKRWKLLACKRQLVIYLSSKILDYKPILSAHYFSEFQSPNVCTLCTLTRSNTLHAAVFHT